MIFHYDRLSKQAEIPEDMIQNKSWRLRYGKDERKTFLNRCFCYGRWKKIK